MIECAPLNSTSPPKQVLILTLPFLESDKKKCKAVCSNWNKWITSFDEATAKTQNIFHIPDIVNAIFHHLDHEDRLKSRRISTAFDFVASKHLNFKLILTDVTKGAILKMGPDLKIASVKVAGLYQELPTTQEGKLACQLNCEEVKSLSFYEGVSKINKEILTGNFPSLQELKYISTTSYVMPPTENLGFLRKLEIRSSVFDETGSLQLFFSHGRLPMLETIELHLQTRLDFLVYLQIHHFVAVHLNQLIKLSLQFGCDFMFANTEISKMFINFPPNLSYQWDEIANTFTSNTNSFPCTLRYLRCEGLGKFRLTTLLYQNLKRLNPNADILSPAPNLNNNNFHHVNLQQPDEGIVSGESDDDDLDEYPGDDPFVPVPLYNHQIGIDDDALSIEEIENYENAAEATTSRDTSMHELIFGES